MLIKNGSFVVTKRIRKIALEEHFSTPGFQGYSKSFTQHIAPDVLADLAAGEGWVRPVVALGSAIVIAGLLGIAPARDLFSGLSNGGVITVGAMLVIALPGSPRAVKQGMDILAPVLAHAVAMADGAGHA